MRCDVGALLAGFRLAEPGSEPLGCVLAPEDEGDLPQGVALGGVELDLAPQGCRSIAAKIDANWIWRITDGEGVALRQGKGAPRGSGTRPKLAILEPCRSVALRAAGVDEEFGDVTHHVVIVWVQLARTLKWAGDGAWAWTTEPVVGVGSGRPFGRAWALPPRRWRTITDVAAVLAVPPCAQVMAALHAPRIAAAREYADTPPARPGERSR